VAEVRRQRSESKKILGERLNVPMDEASLTDSGMAFQMNRRKCTGQLRDMHEGQLRGVAY